MNTLSNTKDSELHLVDLISIKLSGTNPISKDSCIFRVPDEFLVGNELCYTPQLVSIGAFHHGNPKLETWEKKKQRYLLAFLDRTRKSLGECITLVKDCEERAWNFYSSGEKPKLNSDEFVTMMLVDSCFIIEVMLRTLYNRHGPSDYNQNLMTDMILLENQIPFFVLHRLFSKGEDKFIELSIKYFSGLLLTVTEEGDVERIFTNVKRHLESGFEIEHFTDLLRICHLPTILQMPIMGHLIFIPTAARLHKAGMKFKTGTNKCLLDMQSNTTGLLEIPKFKVQENTKCLLKNLIVLEKSHDLVYRYITDCVLFLKMFIETATDVDLLIQNGIIVNSLNDSAAVATLFKDLGAETPLDKSFSFDRVSDVFNAYCHVPWNIRIHMWRATFKHDYCSTPWKIVSTAAAIILLVLTLVQTIFSII